MEVVKETADVLTEAEAKFDNAQYAAAMALFEEADRAQPDSAPAKLYLPACRFLTGVPSGDRLELAWGEMAPVLEQALSRDDTQSALRAIAAARRAVSVCTAALYRSLSVRQISEYAELNKNVQFDSSAYVLDEVKNKLDVKEHVFDEIQRILLEADDQCRCILRVMHDFSRMVSPCGCLAQADEALLVSLFKYMTSEADLIDECGLEAEFSLMDLAEFGCRIPIPEGMDSAAEERNNLIRSTLRSTAALERWDAFAPFAQAAGVSRQALEKKARREQRLEKLMFWKKGKHRG